jgi:pimeloyl-ACP methyl ester carboxylesterase
VSTPASLVLPDGVKPVDISTDRGHFAAHRADAKGPAQGHVLLIPGWTGSKEDFTPLLPLLAADGFDVVAYDQRGQFETSGSDDDDYSLAGLASDALEIAASAFGPEPFHLLGHSFGGLVAQRAALAKPSLLASLGLLCTGPGALGSSSRRPLEQLIQALSSDIDLGQIFEVKEAKNSASGQIMAFLRQRFTSNNRTSLRTMTKHLLDAPDIIDDIAATGIPVWVGRGAGDDAWAWDRQDDMAKRLGTEVAIIDNANHSPAVENPDRLIAAWLPFLLSTR